jgi:hypothetical protein
MIFLAKLCLPSSEAAQTIHPLRSRGVNSSLPEIPQPVE